MTRISILLGSVAAAACAWPALAQTASAAAQGPHDPVVLEDVVVTAQRRAENLQDVPLSVTALTGEALAAARVEGSLAIGRMAPNVEIKTFAGVPNIFIRGVGNNDFNITSISPVTVYRDEVPLASTGNQDFALLDTASVEVLRGPQGTLFGKNTTGGAILFSSQLPGHDFGGYGRIGYGNFDLFEAEAAATLPLGESLSLRLAGMMRRRDGQRTNLHDGERNGDVDVAGVRAILRYNPSEALDARLTAGHGRDRSDFPIGKQVGLINGADVAGYRDPAPDDPTKLDFDGPSRHWVDDTYATLHLRVGDGALTFKSITGLDRSRTQNFLDSDAGAQRLNHDYYRSRASQVSQEFQVAYETDNLKALVGVYGFRETLAYHVDADIVGAFSHVGAGVPLFVDAKRRNTSYAVFGQAAWSLSKRLRLTLGGRYTWDETTAQHRAYLVPGYYDADIPDGAPVDLVPFARGLDADNGAFSGRVAVDYQLAPDVLAYASFNRGFKAGGYNIGVITTPAERTRLGPEYLDAYEAGLKADFLAHRLRINVSAFHYDYSDLQVQIVQFQAGSSVPSLVLENAASAKIDGLEAESTLLVGRTVTLGASLGLLDARYDAYKSAAIDAATGLPSDFSGNRMPGAPKLKGSLSVIWEPELLDDWRTRLSADYDFNSKIYYTPGQDDRLSNRKGYGLFNVRASIAPQDRRWELAVWVRNLTDKDYIVSTYDQLNFGLIPYYYGDRRMYGAQLRLEF